MTRVLVSVRDALEARIALDCGVDLIDVKEPLRGPLGAADAVAMADMLHYGRSTVGDIRAAARADGLDLRIA